jgi:hypothetical protein
MTSLNSIGVEMRNAGITLEKTRRLLGKRSLDKRDMLFNHGYLAKMPTLIEYSDSSTVN